jgi:lipid II:glycine glycyltransferase (peptidoglycan interpeptide bridge formation enzyme)
MMTGSRPAGHLLQSSTWGQLKSHFGWTPVQVQTDSATALVLFRQLPLGLTLAYIPKGPVGDWNDTARCQKLLGQIHLEARRRRTIFLKIEPDIAEASENGGPKTQRAVSFLTHCGFVPADTIQPKTTIVVDISSDEETILAAMKQKTRYNIRLAQRKEVTVRLGTEADLPTFYALARETSKRDGFGIHSLAYYQTAFHLFAPDRCALLLAEYKEEPLAALMTFRHGTTAYYFYGASSNSHRNLMPAYLLQWEAIRWAKTYHCENYDLWGIPDASPARLETEFTQRSDGLWGVYRFKRGFGGQIIRSIGAFDYVYNPQLYKLYRFYRRL